MRRKLQHLSLDAHVLDGQQNYFELFGLPEHFTLDLEELSERYLQLRQTVHPDLYATAGEREKRLSLQASTLVNEAYQTLKDPLARARYLLNLLTGTPSDDQETTKDMAFLMEQMELREALTEARRAPDPFADVAAVQERLSHQSSRLIAQLAASLENASNLDHEASRELIRKLQFVRKCQAEADALEAELDEVL
ncbi:MAG: Fe-S protein assembly co-chaperone HscB [Chromatiaceae bacterium]